MQNYEASRVVETTSILLTCPRGSGWQKLWYAHTPRPSLGSLLTIDVAVFTCAVYHNEHQLTLVACTSVINGVQSTPPVWCTKYTDRVFGTLHMFFIVYTSRTCDQGMENTHGHSGYKVPQLPKISGKSLAGQRTGKPITQLHENRPGYDRFGRITRGAPGRKRVKSQHRYKHTSCTVYMYNTRL